MPRSIMKFMSACLWYFSCFVHINYQNLTATNNVKSCSRKELKDCTVLTIAGPWDAKWRQNLSSSTIKMFSHAWKFRESSWRCWCCSGPGWGRCPWHPSEYKYQDFKTNFECLCASVYYCSATSVLHHQWNMCFMSQKRMTYIQALLKCVIKYPSKK